jgi:hypothetical protein
MRQAIAVVVLATLAWGPAAHAAAPPLLPLQGVLTDADGVPVAGTVSIQFSLYTAETGGTQIWDDTFSVAVVDGLFVAYLGSGTALPLTTFRDQHTLWLQAKVGTDAAMARVHLGSVPFAGYAEYCGNVPTHTHPFTDVTGPLPATALPASVPKGPLACVAAADRVKGIDASGGLVCAPVSWAEIPDRPAGLVAGAQACAGSDKVTGVDAAGALQCGADQGVLGGGTTGHVAAFTAAGTIGDTAITVGGGGQIVLPSGAASIGGAGSGSGLNADLLDGVDSAAFMRKAQNVIVVAKSGGDYTTIGAALASITTNSSGNPFLIKVAPGIYNEKIAMKAYVDIEGSGPYTTVITGAGDATLAAAAVVTGAAGYAYLRNIGVRATGSSEAYVVGIATANASFLADTIRVDVTGGQNAYGVWVGGGTSAGAWMRSCEVYAMNGTTESVAMLFAAGNYASRLEAVSTFAQGASGTVAAGLRFAAPGRLLANIAVLEAYLGGSVYGVQVSSGTVYFSGGRAFAGGASVTSAGVSVTGTGYFESYGGFIYGETNTVSRTAGTARVLGTNLNGGAVSGTVTCAGVSDEAAAFYAGPACP